MEKSPRLSTHFINELNNDIVGVVTRNHYGKVWRHEIYDVGWATWLMLGLVAVCCLVPCFIAHSLWPVTLCLAMLAFVPLTFLGIYYRIDGNKLVVYSFFVPTAYPIDMIKEIKPTKSILSAPATSLSHRLAITFTDRKILRSTTSLIISPVRQEEFIRHLLSINPEISNNPTL